MADVKWIKITTDMFDNRKIKHLRRLPEGNNIVLIWVMLLTMAGRCNAGGMIFLTENIPYTPKMLADELGFEENTVKLALDALEQLEMITTEESFFVIPGWQDHQNTDGLEKIKEQTRRRVAKHRQKQNLLDTKKDCNVTCNVTVTECNATEEDKEREEEKEIDKEKKEKVKEKAVTDYRQIIDLFNDTCVSFPQVRSLSDARKKAINARLKTYSVDDLKKAFELAEASDFLKGKNNRDWQATYDWIMCDRNMAKILDGNYNNRPEKIPPNKSGWKNDADILDGIL